VNRPEQLRKRVAGKEFMGCMQGECSVNAFPAFGNDVRRCLLYSTTTLAVSMWSKSGKQQ
jgi:hypothetical protein